MICPKCKSRIKDDLSVCPKCGYIDEDKLPGLNIDKLQKFEKKVDDSLPDGYPRHYYHDDGKRGVHAIIELYKKTFVYSGVSDMIEYWTQMLYTLIIMLIALFSAAHVIIYEENSSMFIIIVLVVSVTVLIVTLVSISSATVRRLHDAGFSGVWYLLGKHSNILTLAPYKRNENNRPYEKKPTIKIRFEEKKI